MKKIAPFICFIFFVTGSFNAVMALDHSLYDTVLENHVESGFFDYEAFMKDQEDRARLRKYLKKMSSVNPDKLEKDEELAFWINLYNAATLRLIEKHYPVSSIKDIGGWFTSPWEISFIQVGDRTLTLNQVEHDIIRKQFNEPRIHFALVCAASSCPPLRHEAYVADRLDAQLEEQAEVFIRSDRNRYSITGNRVQLKLSSIFSWYGEDFGGEKGVVKYVAKYFPNGVQKLVKENRYSVIYRDYDWSLNQAPGPYKSIDE